MNSAPSKPVLVQVVPEGAMSVSEPMFSGLPDLLTPEHIANVTGLSAQTVRSHMREGVLPCFKIASRLYCPKADLIEYVNVAMKGGSNG